MRTLDEGDFFGDRKRTNNKPPTDPKFKFRGAPKLAAVWQEVGGDGGHLQTAGQQFWDDRKAYKGKEWTGFRSEKRERASGSSIEGSKKFFFLFRMYVVTTSLPAFEVVSVTITSEMSYILHHHCRPNCLSIRRRPSNVGRERKNQGN